MTRLLHLSDLHYGRDRADLEAPLLETIHDLEPDLVAISGDFTQRARVHQFLRAKSFLDRLSQPWIAVPGNHDTPLDNLWVRLVAPWRRYKAAIHTELEPRHADGRVSVVGINTVNRFSWQRGKLSERRVRRACAAFAEAGDRARIAVLHHPLQHGPETRKRLMRGAKDALCVLARCGAEIVLSGHLHNTVVAPFRAEQGLLFVQAGTCLSSRVRGEPNTFNLLDLDGPRLRIETWAAEDLTFRRHRSHRFFRRDGLWRGGEDKESAAYPDQMVSTVRLPLV